MGNEFTYMTPSLPVHVDDPLERVRLTSMATTIAKENHQLLGPTLLPAWLSYLPPALAPGMFRSQARRVESASVMNLTISNVPGPRERGEIEGATVSEIYSVGPVVTGSGMNITVWSYVDQLAISVLTDDLTLDDPHEATDAMIDAFIEIRTAAGLSGDLTPVGTPYAAGRGGRLSAIRDREAALTGELAQGLLHHLADVRVDLGDIGVFAESGGDVDGGQHLSDDLAGQRQVHPAERHPNGNPAATGTISLRVKRLMMPTRLASQVPRVRKNCVSCPPIETMGTIGTPASMAVRTYPVRPLKSMMFCASVGRIAS